MTIVAIARDLRSKFGPVRDQEVRPTCLAFAASDCHAAVRGELSPLSTEYIFYHAQRRGGRSPFEGAVLVDMLDALREDGQPEETGWPYLSTLPSVISKWSPPKKVGQVFKRLGERRRLDFEGVALLLDTDCAPLLIMMVSDAFYRPTRDGVIVAPSSELPDPSRVHAVIAVAHGWLLGKRVMLVRNSWGSGWGLNGYAWLPEAFLTPRLIQVGVLTGPN